MPSGEAWRSGSVWIGKGKQWGVSQEGVDQGLVWNGIVRRTIRLNRRGLCRSYLSFSNVMFCCSRDCKKVGEKSFRRCSGNTLDISLLPHDSKPCTKWTGRPTTHSGRHLHLVASIPGTRDRVTGTNLVVHRNEQEEGRGNL